MDAVLAPRLRLALSRRALRVTDDERLVAEVRAGSRSAFEIVYDRHHAGILAFSRHMLGSREDAEDVVQHTFVAASKGLLDDHEREIALKAWLYAIARNRCLSLLRARREHVSLEDAAARTPATAGLSVEVEQREDLRALLADLQLLPDDQRAALILAELGAHSHEAIAAVLGVPTVKVKALVFQAREALMSRRLARDADCDPIREQLAVLRGGARRRGELRHHIAQCEGCRAFDAEVRRQRAGIAVLLPVAPTLALKQSSLAGAFAAGGSGGAAAGGTAVGGAAGGTVATSGAAGAGGSAALAGGGAAALGVKAVAAKVVIAVALTGAGGGGFVAAQQLSSERAPDPPAHVTSARPDQPSQPGVTPLTAGMVPTNCPTQPADSAGGCPPGSSPRDPVPGAHPALSSSPRDPVPGAQPALASSPDDPIPGAQSDPGSAPGVPAPGAQPISDSEGDGVRNRPDRCPGKPASTPGGCPPDRSPGERAPGAQPIPDSDGDGVPNRQDRCPGRRASTANGCPEG